MNRHGRNQGEHATATYRNIERRVEYDIDDRGDAQITSWHEHALHITVLSDIGTDTDDSRYYPVKAIGEGAFENNVWMSRLTIEEGVEAIHDHFRGCKDLHLVQLPASIDYIVDDAFSDSEDVAVSCPYGSYAYDWCAEHWIPVYTDKAHRIDDMVYETDDEGNATIALYEGSDPGLEVPQFLEGHPVVAVGVSAFRNASLQSVRLPESVSTISDAAFYGCHHLKELVLPKGLKEIGDAAFFRCSNLEALSLPDGLKSIGCSAFESSGLREVEIPDSVDFLGDRAFADCWLERARLPYFCDIGEDLFYWDGVRHGVGYVCDTAGAYDYCMEHEIPLGPTATGGISTPWTNPHGQETYWVDCVAEADGLSIVGGFYFEDLSPIPEALIIPCSLCGMRVISIADGAFAQTGAPIEAPGDERDESIATQEYGISHWTSNDVNDEDMYDLPTHIILSEGIEELGTEAFYGCDRLESVTIPRSVFAIGERCFDDCTNLVIECHKDSFAYRWCLQHGVPCRCPDDR